VYLGNVVFLIAHEVGHVALGYALLLLSVPSKEQAERDADTFAAFRITRDDASNHVMTRLETGVYDVRTGSLLQGAYCF
jgi:hypothetical protein